MARRITGADWAYTAIEKMDTALQKAFEAEIKKLGTSFSKRSCQSTSPLDNAGSHLALAGATFYGKSGASLKKAIKRTGEISAPRPKIIVVDRAWDLSEKLMPQKVSFLTKECEQINSRRCEPWGRNGEAVEAGHDDNHLIRPYQPGKRESESTMLDHGAALIGALRIGSRHPFQKTVVKHKPETTEQPEEWALWNLAPRADIILLPLRDHAPISRSAFDSSLTIALKSEFIDASEHKILSESKIHRFLNFVSDTESNANLSDFVSAAEMGLGREVYGYLKDDSGSSETPEMRPTSIECTGYLDEFFRSACLSSGVEITEIKTLYQNGDSEQVARLYKETLGTFKKCLHLTYKALEEAGIAKTLELVSSENITAGKIGIGDTLVIPIEMDLVNNRIKSGRPNSDPIYDNLEISQFLREDDTSNQSLINEQISRFFEKRKVYDRLQLPIIAYTLVEKSIQKLTCSKKVSVVISGGNSQIDLNRLKMKELDVFLPTPRYGNDTQTRTRQIDRDLFRSRSTKCGAIIVGSGMAELADIWADPLGTSRTRPQHRTKRLDIQKNHREILEAIQNGNASSKSLSDTTSNRVLANYGMCVDAYGRGSTMDIDKLPETKVSRAMYEHWSGASIASIVTAACLANVQHIRMLHDFIQLTTQKKPNPQIGPYKPFEARAHLRVWKSLDSWRYPCLQDLMGPPPDIRAWFQGTCFVSELEEYVDMEEWLSFPNP